MLQRHVRVAARGDDWGCCPAKPVRPLQRKNVTSVHYKNSQTAADEDPVVPHSTVRASWSGEVRVRAQNSSTDPVTAEAGLNAGGSGGGAPGTCWAPIYAVVASSVVIAALIIALVVVFVRRRRRCSSATGSSNGGGGQWNKKLAGILTPARCHLLRERPRPTGLKAAFDELPNTACSSTISSTASSKRPLTGNQRHGYAALPGTVYPAARATTTQRRDPNPYGLPPSQCSYHPQRVKVVTLKRKRTIDSETGDVDDERERSASYQYAEVDNEIAATKNELQSLLPLTSLRSLFGVVSGVFGVVPTVVGGQQPVLTDRRSSCIATQLSVTRVDGPTSSTVSSEAQLTAGHISDANAELRRDSNVVTQPIDASRDMGVAASTEPSLSGSDRARTTSPVQSSTNDCESVGSGGALDNVQTSSMATLDSSTATQSAVVSASDLDVAPAGSDDVLSQCAQSQRQSVAEKCSVDSNPSTRRQSAQSTGSTTFDVASRQTTTTTLGRIGGLADALGLGDLIRSVTGSQQAESEKLEPFWVPPGLQVQKRRAQSLQSSLPVSEFETSNVNAKNGKL